LFFTRIHTNRWWTVFQEVMVLAYGALVAVMQGSGMWRMFAFGFGGIFIITQMHGLGLSRTVRWIILALYMGAAVVAYGLDDLSMNRQITWVPIIEYSGMLILAGLFGAGLWVTGRIEGRPSPESQAAGT
jgi:hypothetical protein